MPRTISSKVLYRRTRYLTVKLVFCLCRYAFVVYHTFRDAEHNLRRPIDYDLLGPKCRIEYASYHSTVSDSRHSFDNKTLVVRRIPDNVSENDLRRLFVDCRSVNYYSAVTKATKSKNKILLG
jgi:RNA recognition motif-containing protein